MRRLHIVLSLIIVVILAGCTQASSESGNEQSTYADYVTVKGKHYINAWELALVNRNGLSAIGKVEHASVDPEGARVYSIAGYSEQDVIAVKHDRHPLGLATNLSGYLIYVQQEENGTSHYPNITNQTTNQIQIYQGNKLLRELRDEEDVKAFLTLFNQPGPFNEIQSDSGTEYTVLLLGEGTFGFNYGVIVQDGHYGLRHTESKLPDDIAVYFR